jgi:hypothetical protein
LARAHRAAATLLRTKRARAVAAATFARTMTQDTGERSVPDMNQLRPGSATSARERRMMARLPLPMQKTRPRFIEPLGVRQVNAPHLQRCGARTCAQRLCDVPEAAWRNSGAPR